MSSRNSVHGISPQPSRIRAVRLVNAAWDLVLESQNWPPSLTVSPTIWPTMEMSAAIRITEILEQIILALPPNDILLAQRVCKGWQMLIAHSATIQHKLFFNTLPMDMRMALNLHDDVPFPNSWATTTLATYLRFRNIMTMIPFSVVDTDTLERVVSLTPLDIPPFETSDSLAKMKALEFKGASWRKMFITQPPVQNCVVLLSDWREGGRATSEVVVRTAGVTFGEVVARVDELTVFDCPEVLVSY